MELREMLVIIGLVLIAVIVWDGIRRMQARKKTSRYRGSYTKTTENEDYQDPDELKRQAELSRELPNGGARIRHMTPEERAQLTSRLNLRERVPMLMDSVEVPPEPNTEAETSQPSTDQPAKQQSLDFDRPMEPSSEGEERSQPTKAAEPTPGAEAEPEFEYSRDDEPSVGDWHFSAADDFEPDFGDLQDIDEDTKETLESSESEAEQPGLQPSNHSESEQPDSLKSKEAIAEANEPELASAVEEEWTRPEQTHASSAVAAAGSTEQSDSTDDQYEEDTRPVEELVIMHVMSKGDRDIAGSELLELLLRAGLRFGPMDIFHYRNPKGQLEFSLANSVQPGTLNPDTMEQMTTPGITLFMQLPQHADMMSSFDHLYEMAVFLAKQLDAVILDEEHSTVTAQRVEHYRERLRNFARTQLIQAHE